MREFDGLFTTLHPLVRAANHVANCFPFFLQREEKLTPENLMNGAIKATGLEKWDDEVKIVEALNYLTSPLKVRMQLTPVGACLLHSFLLDRLKSRLLIQQLISQSPAIFQVPVSRPLLIVGLPRSGTSLLQNLLSLDPNCHRMMHWFTVSPAPPPDPSFMDRDPRIKEAGRNIWLMYKMAPELATLHYSSADSVDECLLLLMNSFMTETFSMVTDFSGYEEWLDGQDRVAAYRLYRSQLQILQWHFPREKHWVLKSPAHLDSLHILLSVFPDISIVHVHRNPVESIPSLLSMRLKVLGIFNEIFPDSIVSIIEDTIMSFRRIASQSIAIRENFDRRSFYDVYYVDLMKDPVRTIKNIYAYFNYGWSDEFAERIRSWMARNFKNKYGVHRYSLDQFGLTEGEISEKFKDYCFYYNVSRED